MTIRVKYQAFRKEGVDLTGKIVDMDEAEAAPLIRSNIVVPVEVEVEAETAAVAPPENAMRPPPRRKHVAKSQRRANR